MRVTRRKFPTRKMGLVSRVFLPAARDQIGGVSVLSILDHWSQMGSW